MKMTFRRMMLLPALALALFVLGAAQPEKEDLALLRQKAQKMMNDSNFKDAFELYEKIALDPNVEPKLVGNDLTQGVFCLQRLNRQSETDSFREKVIQAQAGNWRLLRAAAQNYFNSEHYGYIVAGNFERGQHRGGGKYVNSFERDRVRALQLMDRALQVVQKSDLAKNESSEVADFYMEFARNLMGYRGYGESWRLQYLTDLATLPDYDEGYGRYYYGNDNRAAPVNEDGTPVYHRVPESYEKAQTDGERWRWMLAAASNFGNSHAVRAKHELATFLRQQFGVQTMAYYGRWFRGDSEDDAKKDESGTYALHTLGENETIARLATGIKRFALPEEFDFIRLHKEIADAKHNIYSRTAIETLAQTFEDRRQYDTAVKWWQRAIEEYGSTEWRRQRIDQILKNWGQFEPVMTHPAGKEASVEFRFRNGQKVSFAAQRIHIRTLLADIKEYLKSNPRELDWNRMNLGNIGYMLVNKEISKYVGEQVAAWDLPLEPRKLHFDRRITVQTPLKDPGAYLLTATMADGNISRVIIWIDNTVLVKKQLDKKPWFFLADAVTGAPLPKFTVEFFGYRQELTNLQKVIGRRYNVLTTAFAENTDADGQIMPEPKYFNDGHQWLITAANGTDEKPGDRLAFLGFTGIWHGNYYDTEYNQTKVYFMSDRPVYRPSQPLKFKFWVRHAQYDQEDSSSFAKQNFRIELHNPKDEKVFEKSFTADEYGGFDGEYFLPKDATLGMYSMQVWQGGSHIGAGSFRVEEYKKPEFEVKVEAPTEPVMLGEKITAKIQAKYYFGAPVTQGKIKYKVQRMTHSGNWYPWGYWDWFYGPGYWWFAYDYKWWPGWGEWGCYRPRCWWWPAPYTPPEIVAEAEVPVGEDGTFKVDIDTAIAKAMHPDTDHRYEITAEVTDQSRRTIVGQGSVLVARKPFKVYAWVDRGHYRVGDVVHADFAAQTLDNKPVKGKGDLKLYRVSYKTGIIFSRTQDKPVETEVQDWKLDTDDEGRSRVQIKASKPGQYRLSYKVTDAKKHTIEGGYVFCVMGQGFDGKDYRFNELELVPDQKEYAAGDKARLMVNTDRNQGTVVLFVRPANGVGLPPKVIRLNGKSAVETIEITKKDMPNFFVEAFTISDGRLFTEMREIIVPPESRVLNVDVTPSAKEYKPGDTCQVKVKLTDIDGKPFTGSTVMSVYDKSVEYISGGSNVPEIREFFWKWRRHHNIWNECSLNRYFHNLLKEKETGMAAIGAFGNMIADEEGDDETDGQAGLRRERGAKGGDGNLRYAAKARASVGWAADAAVPCAPMALAAGAVMEMDAVSGARGFNGAVEKRDGFAEPSGAGAGGAMVQPTVRSKFADTAFWTASLKTDEKGVAEVEFKMPENLTGWKIRTWAMGHGTKVGEGAAEAVTVKNLVLRLQAPRFFVEKDEVVLSANIHNYLKTEKPVRAVLELDGNCLEIIGNAETTVKVDAKGEKRVDWRVKVLREGEATVRMKALTNEESDAMEMKFPVYVHGMLKTDSFSGVVRRDKNSASITLNVPAERRVDQSLLEVRYSPTLAGAMVDALPYLAEYPYGCTEQTLNKFLPTVITQKILKDMGLNLKDIRDKQTNLNAQEIGDDKKRMEDWKRLAGTHRWNGKDWEPRNPVFDEAVVNDMVREGLQRLAAMQLSDGGWGWFSGWGEHSWPHTTAYVVHGLQTAKDNGVALLPGMLESGVKWLVRHQAEQVRMIKNAEKKVNPYKEYADNLDAFIYMVLADAALQDEDMREFLYRDRDKLAVYAKSMYGLALHKQGHTGKRDMLIRNIEQYLVEDAENQSAWLRLGNEGYWWYWYGSEYEALAYYLKLLAATDAKSDRAAGLVKYLLNNRRHASYWNSTRDTAVCIEALADYLRASGEDKPDMTVEIWVDGQKMRTEKITADNLFSFNNKFVMEGKAVQSGQHMVEVRRTGKGPVYFNAYLTNFTLEDFITRAGLEIKVERKYYRLIAVDKKIKASGSRGQVLDKKVEKYERKPLTNGDVLKSGDLVEIELEIASKNDYEYIVFEDMKAAGFEPVDIRSGYNGNDMGAYMEFRDERVCLFIRALARGTHSVAYRVRAEIPGKFSALPTRAYAMYAPELKANSDEIKLGITD